MYGWEFPPFISGGLGVACYDLTKALTDLGIDVNFVLPVLPKQIKSHVNLISSSEVELQSIHQLESYEKFLESINFIKIESLLHPYINETLYQQYLKKLEQQKLFLEDREHFYKFNFTGMYGPNLFSEVLRYSYIAGKIAEETPHEVIHTHDWLTVLAGIEAKKVSGKPLIYHVHALETDRSGVNTNKQVYEIEKHGLEQADKVIAVSNYTKNCIIDYYGINSRKIEVVHNAVSKEKYVNKPNRFKKRADEKIVLFLGRVTYQKGPDYFLEAAAKVLAKDKNIRFVIAGVGDMVNRLIERTAELKIGRYVHFTGFLNRQEIEELFSSTDVYVMSSVSEPFGISSLEAILFDVPVVISKQSGVAEILNSALKVDFWDVNDLANKIYGIIKYPALQKELNEKAAEELKHIQWEKSAQKVINIYNQVQLNYA